MSGTRPLSVVVPGDSRVPGWNKRAYPWLVLVSYRITEAIAKAEDLGLGKSEWRWASRASQTLYFPYGQPFMVVTGFCRQCPRAQREELESRFLEIRAVQLTVR